MSKITLIGAAIICAALIAKPIIHFSTMETISSAVITDKERIGSGDDGKYLIWSETETFANEDSWLAFKFNSSDVYGKMRVGSTCDLKVNGFRIPFLSRYRNIMKATCV